MTRLINGARSSGVSSLRENISRKISDKSLREEDRGRRGNGVTLYMVSGSGVKRLVECGEGIKGESCYILPQVNGHFSPVSSRTIIRGVIKFAAARERRATILSRPPREFNVRESRDKSKRDGESVG